LNVILFAARIGSYVKGSSVTRGRAPRAWPHRSRRAPTLPVSSCDTTAIARPLPAPRSAVSFSTTSFSAASHVADLNPPLPSRNIGPAIRSGW
jgi:hypothetical protein